ncbi:fam-l protein [Plasmodium malariae]|uniref:Fam-l protein n=1 Tax=Plasmodium malariae TaxID=5858 RepID=A0A1D3RHW2_PLAMA|nr:fam-l protein [Plasmodium malariae]SCN44542.1 fam-l protein [Plasmodium malariae]
MRQNIKSDLFIEIAYIILLSWIYHFSNDTSTVNKSFHETNIIVIKSGTISYRLLAKCKLDRYSCNVNLIEGIPTNKVNEKYYISNSEKRSTEKNKYSNGHSSRSRTGHKQDMKSKCYIFEKNKCSYMEKKIFKEFDFIDYLKNNRTISNKIYKKVIRKKYGLQIATPVLLFFLLLILLIVDFSLGISIEKSLLITLVKWDPLQVLNSGWFSFIFNKVKGLEWLWKSSLWNTSSNSLGDVRKKNVLLGHMIGVPLYFLPLFLLGIIFIFVLVYYHKKVRKYEKIKFKKR